MVTMEKNRNHIDKKRGIQEKHLANELDFKLIIDWFHE